MEASNDMSQDNIALQLAFLHGSAAAAIRSEWNDQLPDFAQAQYDHHHRMGQKYLVKGMTQ